MNNLLLQKMYVTNYNTWVTGVYMVHMFDRNSRGKTTQIK